MPQDLPRSWPNFPSAWSLMSTSSLSPALPGAVSVHVGGGDEVGEEACGRKRRKEASYSRVLLCIHCIFPGCSLQGVNLACPTLDSGCWGEQPSSGAVCVQALFPAQAARLVPWCWSGLGALCRVTWQSPDSPPAEPYSAVFPRALPWLGPRHPTLSPEGRIPAQHHTSRKLGLTDG